MSMNFGASEKDTSGSQNQQTNPWAPTMPYLQGFLGNIWNQYQANGSGAPSTVQNQAFQTLENNARAGDPNAGAIRQLSTDMLSSGSWTPTLQDSYNNFKTNVTPMATADVDPTQAPGMADVLQTIRDDISKNVNGQFAAAGRDLSGANTQTLARGIAQGEAVPLLNQYNQNVQNKLAANQGLLSAGGNTATTGQALDAARTALRTGGIDVGNQALTAENYAPNSLLTLEQQRLGLPFGNMGMLASLLYPMAGLGGQSQGNYNQQQTQVGGNLGFGLCDRRAKENIQEIGTLFDGTPIYRYNYKGDNPANVFIGPMAQDVKKATPDAVTDGPAGMMMVNLDLATREAAALAERG